MKNYKKLCIVITSFQIMLILLGTAFLDIMFLKTYDYFFDTFPNLFIILFNISIIIILICLLLIEIYIYNTCKLKNENPVLWFLILPTNIILVTIVYFIINNNKYLKCDSCNFNNEKNYSFCMKCGKILNKNNFVVVSSKPAITGLILLIISQFLFIFLAIPIFFSTTSSLNTIYSHSSGILFTNFDKKLDNEWKKATSKSIGKSNFTTFFNIDDKDNQQLNINISFNSGENLKLTISQDEITKEINIDKNNFNQTLPLKEFKNGKLKIKFEFENIKDLKSNIKLE